MSNQRILRSLFLTATLITAASSAQAKPDEMLREAALFVGNFLPPPPTPTNGILRYDGRGNFIDNMIPTGTGGNVVTCCMAFGPDENLYVSSPPTGRVLRFNGVTGEFIDVFVPAGSGSLLRPLVLLFHGGYLYVGDTEAGIIRRYDAITGAYVDDFVGLPSPASVFDLQHFAFGPDGNLYIAAEVSRQVLRYDGTSLDIFVPTSDGFSPSGMTFGPDGFLYVSSFAGSEVRRYDLSTGSHEVLIPAGGRLVAPVGIVFGPDGNFYATSVGTSQVLRYDSTGRFLDAFVDSGEGGITGPRMITWKVKTTVCHSPEGNGGGGAKTLTIGYLSGHDHLQHGDTLGPCN